jgi:hypothetical protein
LITITERLIIINGSFLIDFKWSVLGPPILITLSAIIISDLHCIYIYIYIYIANNPITGLDRLWVFQEVGVPRFQDNRHMKVVRLSALHIYIYIYRERERERIDENRISKRVLYVNLGTTTLRGRARNRWQDEVREDRRIVGGEGWREKVHNREECKKFLKTARNRRILHMPME